MKEFNIHLIMHNLLTRFTICGNESNVLKSKKKKSEKRKNLEIFNLFYIYTCDFVVRYCHWAVQVSEEILRSERVYSSF